MTERRTLEEEQSAITAFRLACQPESILVLRDVIQRNNFADHSHIGPSREFYHAARGKIARLRIAPWLKCDDEGMPCATRKDNASNRFSHLIVAPLAGSQGNPCFSVRTIEYKFEMEWQGLL